MSRTRLSIVSNCLNCSVFSFCVQLQHPVSRNIGPQHNKHHYIFIYLSNPYPKICAMHGLLQERASSLPFPSCSGLGVWLSKLDGSFGWWPCALKVLQRRNIFLHSSNGFSISERPNQLVCMLVCLLELNPCWSKLFLTHPEGDIKRRAGKHKQHV